MLHWTRRVHTKETKVDKEWRKEEVDIIIGSSGAISVVLHLLWFKLHSFDSITFTLMNEAKNLF